MRGWVGLLRLGGRGELGRVLRGVGWTGLERLGSLDEVWTGPGRTVGRALVEELGRRWAEMEKRDEAAASEELVRLSPENQDDEFRLEDFAELRDKCHDGIDVLWEHAEMELPDRVRFRLELGMARRFQDGLDYLREVLRDFADRDEHRLSAQEQRVRFFIRSLDAHYGDCHVAFLNAYLQAHPEAQPNDQPASLIG